MQRLISGIVKRKNWILIGVLIFLAGFGGLVYYSVSKYGSQEKINIGHLDEARYFIQREYINQPVSDSLLLYGAIEEIVRTLDDSSLKFERPNKIKRQDKTKTITFSRKSVARDIAAGWNVIKSFYPEKIWNDNSLLYPAMRGMVKALNDPYSTFHDPKETREMIERLQGNVSGIGIQIIADETRPERKDQATAVIIDVLPESPAARAGIRIGDIITQVDGKTYMTHYNLRMAMLGQVGTRVKLTIRREGVKEPIEISVVRESFNVPPVEWKMLSDIAYLRLEMFSFGVSQDKILAIIRSIQSGKRQSPGPLDQAVNEILKANPKGLIFDLRKNLGGQRDEALVIASYWTGPRTVMKEKYPSGMVYDTKPSLRAQFTTPFGDLPTVVLVDRYTASASEIVAGALQYYKLAFIVGEPTYGKAVAQRGTFLKCGGMLRITSVAWYTPDGKSIEGKGIIPDVKIITTIQDQMEGKDPALEKALEILNQ